MWRRVPPPQSQHSLLWCSSICACDCALSASGKSPAASCCLEPVSGVWAMAGPRISLETLLVTAVMSGVTALSSHPPSLSLSPAAWLCLWTWSVNLNVTIGRAKIESCLCSKSTAVVQETRAENQVVLIPVRSFTFHCYYETKISGMVHFPARCYCSGCFQKLQSRAERGILFLKLWLTLPCVKTTACFCFSSKIFLRLVHFYFLLLPAAGCTKLHKKSSRAKWLID